jgi:hypothetical protein
MRDKREIRIRLDGAVLNGEMLLDGFRIGFSARVDGQKVDAEFRPTSEGQVVDEWTAFRALERWIDENLRG